MIVYLKWFLYFIIYAFIGWIIEVLFCFTQSKKLVNRGFLIGPICPIYGCGVLLIVLLIGRNTTDILSVFLKSILICSILEYFTSYIMEKLFNARWWDYSRYKYNINGRICLETMIPFGILGSLVILYLHPFVERIVSHFSDSFILIIGIILLVLFIIDNIISFNVLSKIKNEIKNHRSDSTEIIRKKVIAWLNNNTFVFKHIALSFPKFIVNKKDGVK